VRAQGVVEVQQPVVAALQDRDRGDRLGDRADAVLNVWTGHHARADGGTTGTGPHQLAVAQDAGHQ